MKNISKEISHTPPHDAPVKAAVSASEAETPSKNKLNDKSIVDAAPNTPIDPTMRILDAFCHSELRMLVRIIDTVITATIAQLNSKYASDKRNLGSIYMRYSWESIKIPNPPPIIVIMRSNPLLRIMSPT
jgi:hypothetical protein